MFEVEIPSSSGSKTYRVVETPDSRNGGTYLKCTCAGWAFAIKKGGCKHVKEAARLKAAAESIDGLTPSQATALELSTGFEVPAAAVAKSAGVRTPIDAMLALKVEAPRRGPLDANATDANGKRWPTLLRQDMAFEPKWDGYRLFVEARGGNVKLWARSMTLVNASFPELAEAARFADGVFDGEVIALSEGGAHTFNALQNVGSMTPAQRAARLKYVVWDVLEANGESLMRRPYRERREMLVEAHAAGLGLFAGDAGDKVILNPSLTDGVAMWNAVISQGMEGVIAKPLGGSYHEGQRSDWLKLKPLGLGEFVVVAYYEGLSGDKQTTYPFGGLVLGEEVDGRLVYAGKVGTGWTDAMIEELMEPIRQIVRPTAPVEWPSVTLSKMKNGMAPRKLFWLEPQIRVTVEFQERGADGVPRFPSYKGMRWDA